MDYYKQVKYRGQRPFITILATGTEIQYLIGRTSGDSYQQVVKVRDAGWIQIVDWSPDRAQLTSNSSASPVRL